MIFCDWLSIYQEHFGIELPPQINDGGTIRVDKDGNVESITKRKLQFKGSFETSILIRVEGHRVTLEGNIGRLNRPDNLFGFTVLECILKANELLESLNIPKFTVGQYTPDVKLHTGAKITRVDLTCNYALGSEKNGRRFLSYLATQDSRRASVKQYGQSGVTWGEGSRYWYAKCYFKADSLGKQVSQEIRDFATTNGIVRHEITLKSQFLREQKLNTIQAWKNDMKDQNVIYNRFNDILTRGECVHTEIDNIDGKLGLVATAWRSGKDIYNDSTIPKRTLRRYRSELLKYGIDIKQPAKIQSLVTRVKVLEATALAAPDWYWETQNLKQVA